MVMLGYMIRRLLIAIPLLVVVSLLTFALNQLSPLDPAEVVLQAQEVPVITPELIAATRSELGMDRPFLIRYADWLVQSLRLNYGDSYVTGEPVRSMLGPAFLNTFKLALVSVIAIIALSVAFGVFCALREGSGTDRTVRGVSFVLTSVPPYLLATLMTWYFAVKLDWLPTSGMESFASYVLPVSVITVSYAGIYFRMIRTSMIGNLHEDYVLYARASGLPERIVTRHLLRNSMQVAVSVFGMAIPIILGSTVVAENLFAWPGLGTLSVKAIESRDLPIIQAYVLVLAAAFVLFNTVADIVNAALNPRLREDAG
jgi:nickel transport system permease protein